MVLGHDMRLIVACELVMYNQNTKNQVNISLEYYEIYSFNLLQNSTCLVVVITEEIIMIQLNTIEGIVRFIFATKQGTYVLSVHMKSVKPAKELTVETFTRIYMDL